MQKIQIFRHIPPDAAEIRSRVFMEEQGFQNEFDEADDISLHFVLYIGGTAAGTARMFTENDGKSYHLGRIAVLPAYRGKHYGAELVHAMCRKAAELGAEMCELSAQCRVKDFYTKLGFETQGSAYMDEFCPHIRMVKKL